MHPRLRTIAIRQLRRREGVFTGSNCWLDIGVRTNGFATGFTALTPRQPVLPTPYAIFATTASNLVGSLAATQLVGTLPSSQISGNYSNSVSFTNVGNIFSARSPAAAPTWSI